MVFVSLNLKFNELPAHSGGPCSSQPIMAGYISVDSVIEHSSVGAIVSFSTDDLIDASEQFWGDLACFVQDAEHGQSLNIQDIIRHCDALRICNRRLMPLSDVDFHDRARLLLAIVKIYFNSNGLFDEVGTASLTALKCMVNLLINQSHRMHLFCTEDSSSCVVQLCEALANDSVDVTSDLMLSNVEYIVKILFMIKSQSPECLSSDIITAETLTRLVEALVCALFRVYQVLIRHLLDTASAGRLGSVYCDICKLLYALDVYPTLDLNSGLEVSPKRFLLTGEAVHFHQLQLSLMASSDDTPAEEDGEEKTSGHHHSCMAVLSSILFHTLMLTTSDWEEGTKHSVEACQAFSLQLCMLASQETVDRMFASGEERFLLCNYHTIKTIAHNLCGILKRHLQQSGQAVIDSEAGNDQQSYLLSPVLVFCSKLISSNDETRREFKEVVFPNPYTRGAHPDTVNSEYYSQNMLDPTDVPENSLRALLIPLMCSINTQIKRCVSEFIYNLCENSDEFVSRTGFGNAIALLQIKGFI